MININTFLPYKDFQKSAQCLDNKRLGKQRVEAWQIYQILKKISDKENYKTIKLSNGQYTKLNENDYKKYKSVIMYMGGSHTPSVQCKIKGKRFYLHRLITNCPKGFVVDHINQDTLDNRRCNLRICTHQENLRNSKPRLGTSKYKGVNFDKTTNKWYSCIRYNNKTYNLGRFKNEKDAAKAYDKKAKELYGEFMCLNFPKRNGYANHPAVQMWKGYESALLTYGVEICEEWINRGFKDSMLHRFINQLVNKRSTLLIYPSWLGNEDFHRAMRSNLLRKNPKWYGQFGWTEPNNLHYIWGDVKLKRIK